MTPEEYAQAQDREALIQETLSRLSLRIELSSGALVIRIMAGEQELCSDWIATSTLRTALGD